MERIINWLTNEQGSIVLDYALVLVPIIVSCIAIAISVKTAKKQNKIALFDKRFEAYANLLKLKAFADILKRTECSFEPTAIAKANPQNIDGEKGRRCSEVLSNFQAFFYNGDKKPDGVNVARVMLYTVRTLELSVQTLPMLYSKVLRKNGMDANKEITEIFESLAAFISSLISCDSNNEKYRVEFVEKMDTFADKYSNVFEKGLRL